jgi:hypothetical protein
MFSLGTRFAPRFGLRGRADSSDRKLSSELSAAARNDALCLFSVQATLDLGEELVDNERVEVKKPPQHASHSC